MQIQPLGDRVLIRIMHEASRTKSGLYIPESAQESKKEGIVAAIGNGEECKKLGIQQGDKVIYGGYSNEEIEIDNQKHVVIEVKDIIARIVG